ncbi:chemotaxis protein CheA [Novosphingobium sp. AAP83]|uniref:chemotaxis protein CheA n=1 Tax=Novosphingobium sp. AAP83 TaxID=1523425 RepID=UPI0006B9F8E0|nr:chemotaxis protein CheA [Novosphingobium sp. AAP83]KPF90852.1 chemotaxis protein CheA [Novosphingobium sp. AAP83]
MSGSDPVAAFRVEAFELLDQIENDLLDLGQDLGNRALVDAVFRGLHTLKGSGSMFGFDALASFTHHCETAFDRVRKGQARATAALVGVILSARDQMRALLDETIAPDEAAQAAILAALQAAVADDGAATTAPAADAANVIEDATRLTFRLAPSAMANGNNPLNLLGELRELGATKVCADLSRLPPLDQLVPGECHIGWTMLLPASVTRDDIEDVFMFVMDDMELTLEELEPASAASEIIAVAETGTAAPSQARTPSAPAAESVRVPAERLDELMNRVGELVIAQSRLAQIAAQGGTINEIALRAVSEDIERLSSELRDTTMVLRMMQVGGLFGRFRRLVHDLAQETGKSIEFSTEGETTEVDKTVIERLADPMVHLIRNSCDHGLETAEQRIANGKAGTGQIMITATQTGGEVIITVADDGRGINRDAVRAKAEAQGLIAPDAVLADQDVLQLIFHPGFSTAAQVTNLSGRGVGMDVVKKTIEGLRGTIRMTSVEGQGTRIMLHLPLTLAIVECMLVRVGSGCYAIPLSAVEECLELPASEAAGGKSRSFLDVRGELIPFLRMREAFATDWPAELHQKIVIVGAGDTRVGLVIDQIIGNAQTVIKPLSRFHAGLGTFSGATILGDGTVALILDVGNLLASAQRQSATRAVGEAA